MKHREEEYKLHADVGLDWIQECPLVGSLWLLNGS